MSKRGYFEIGIYCPKMECNYGTLMRSAYQLGASGIFTIGARYKRLNSDTCNSSRHIPARSYKDFEEFLATKPKEAQIIAVEDPKYGGKYLKNYCHPVQAIYLLGNESTGLPEEIVKKCNGVVSIESDRTYSYNVSVAGSLVMYDRLIKGMK